MTDNSVALLIRRYTDLLNQAIAAYYKGNASVMSDDAFNELYQTLTQLVQQYPHLECADSPTLHVGSDLTEYSEQQVQYSCPMLSIATHTDSSDAPAQLFAQRLQAALGRVEVIVEPKYDGLATNLRYIDSVLVSVSTRGNKYRGENVTHNAHLLAGVPHRLPQLIKGVLDIRGEVIFPTALPNIPELEGLQNWYKNYATARHAASAMLRTTKGLPQTPIKPLRFMVYGIGDSDSYHPCSQFEALEQLTQWGFYYEYDLVKVVHTAEQMYEQHQVITQARSRLGFDIDGVVYKANRFEDQQKLGVSGKEPRWSIAHKFPAQAVSTEVLDIQYEVGKTGNLTPLVYIQPVQINGITVTKINGHNFYKLREKRIKVGAKVMVELAGEVIPFISMSLPTAQYLPNPQPPKVCPCCQTTLVRPKGMVKHRCPNQHSCTPQLTARLTYFAGRECANLDGLGTKVCELLVTHCGVDHPAKLFKLSLEALQKSLTLTANQCTKIMTSIESLHSLDPAKLIAGIGIQGLLQTSGQKVVDSGWAGILPILTEAELTEGVGLDTATATEVVAHFAVTANRTNYWALLQRLAPQIPQVFNKHHRNTPEEAVYIGRPSKWGNMFTHLGTTNLADVKVATRQEAVQRYEQYLLSQPQLLAAAREELKGRHLECWCAPSLCHGHILIKHANR